MPKFSSISQVRLATCHPDIVAVCRELIKQYDFAVLCGHRTQDEQNKAFERGTSRLRYPQSPHNKTPSHAVDLAPYPIDWNNRMRFGEMWHRFDAIARLLRERGEIESEFEWGGAWNTLQDCPHIEIKENEHGMDSK